jgi:plasmid replication initiation protein
MNTPLLPDRHPQGDFFVCDIFDAAPKGDVGSMEHPIFSLSTKPDTRPRKYEHRGVTVEIKPSSDGLATIHDRDVLIFCISQLIRAMDERKEISQIVRFQAVDLLRATNRMTTGRGYELLKAAMERLAGTRISTNIATGGQEIFETFGLIERARIVRESRDGRMQEVEVKLSDWVFNAIRAQEVLTLSRDYFRLRRPLERRLYELARKHCGRQPEWRIGLDLLQKKCGSGSPSFEFRRLVGRIVREDERHAHFPDYAIRFSEDGEQILFQGRGTVPAPAPEAFQGPLEASAHDEARRAAPGWDVHYLEQEWRRWCGAEEIEPKAPTRHFVKFCSSWFEKRGRP